MGEYFLDTQSGILTEILNIFNTVFKSGAEAVAGGGVRIAMALLVLQWFKAIALMGMSRQNITQAVIYVAGATAWYQATTNIVSIADSFMNYMGSIGGNLAGSLGSGAAVRNPSAIFATALKSVGAIAKPASKMSFIEGDGMAIMMIVFLGGCILLVCMVLGAIAVVTVVQAYIDLLVAVALMPFAIEPGTRFLAMPGIGKILSAGASLGTVSALIGGGLGVMQRAAASMPEGGEQAMRYAANMLCASIVIAILAGCGLIFSRMGVSKLVSGSTMVGR
jgi:hypothetical protein